MSNFDTAVLQLILNITRHRGGSRFPNPIPLCYCGEPTDYAKALELIAAEGWKLNSERLVHAAVKRLHKAGEVRFIARFGYTWVVPKDHYLAPLAGDAVVDAPEGCNKPYYWEEL